MGRKLLHEGPLNLYRSRSLAICCTYPKITCNAKAAGVKE